MALNKNDLKIHLINTTNTLLENVKESCTNEFSNNIVYSVRYVNPKRKKNQ